MSRRALAAGMLRWNAAILEWLIIAVLSSTSVDGGGIFAPLLRRWSAMDESSRLLDGAVVPCVIIVLRVAAWGVGGNWPPGMAGWVAGMAGLALELSLTVLSGMAAADFVLVKGDGVRVVILAWAALALGLHHFRPFSPRAKIRRAAAAGMLMLASGAVWWLRDPQTPEEEYRWLMIQTPGVTVSPADLFLERYPLPPLKAEPAVIRETASLFGTLGTRFAALGRGESGVAPGAALHGAWLLMAGAHLRAAWDRLREDRARTPDWRPAMPDVLRAALTPKPGDACAGWKHTVVEDEVKPIADYIRALHEKGLLNRGDIPPSPVADGLDWLDFIRPARLEENACTLRGYGPRMLLLLLAAASRDARAAGAEKLFSDIMRRMSAMVEPCGAMTPADGAQSALRHAGLEEETLAAWPFQYAWQGWIENARDHARDQMRLFTPMRGHAGLSALAGLPPDSLELARAAGTVLLFGAAPARRGLACQGVRTLRQERLDSPMKRWALEMAEERTSCGWACEDQGALLPPAAPASAAGTASPRQ
ncbi:MAG: hypothetical protein GMKNLPBB_02544 [Myxococcota bacterium]|nr:hypothetical protein [Myxococcota bacterium]